MDKRKQMAKKAFFTDEELTRIEEAVKQAEVGITGEIVPVFVQHSETYGQAQLRAGMALAALASMLWLALYEFAAGWGAHWFYTPEALLLLAVLGFFIGFILSAFFPLFKLLFVLKKEIQTSVERSASLAFTEYEVFHTEKRTGVLLYISKLEHRVHIMGDKGIAEKVSQDEWNHVLDSIILGLKSGNKTDGICKAISETGQLLHKYGFVADANNRNELPNNLRIQE